MVTVIALILPEQWLYSMWNSQDDGIVMEEDF
jgi:hypothetical protein